MKTQATLVMLLVLGVTSSLLADTVTVHRHNMGHSVGPIHTPTTSSEPSFVGGVFAFDIQSHTGGNTNDDYRTYTATEALVQDNVTSSDETGWVVGFCIDLKEYIGTNESFDEITLATAPKPHSTLTMFPMGDIKANAIRELWAANIDDALLSPDNAVGFQLAVWEIVYESWDEWADLSSLSVSNGDGEFYVKDYDSGNKPEVDTANDYLGTITGTGRRANIVAWSAPSGGVDDHVQDQIVEIIPEPSTLAALVSMGLMGLVIVWRRRQRRS